MATSEILPNSANWDAFKTLILLVTLRIQYQPRGVLCIFGSRTFVPIRWMCKKLTSVSHSSTKSKIIALDAGLRMDGLPALDFLDVVKEVLCSTNSTKTPTNPASGNRFYTGNYSRNTFKLKQKEIVACGPRPHKRTFLSGKSQLYMFEDNEAVIKIMMKDRSPTMRHVSRTHRVAIDWLLDRINLDSRFQIKYVDTKNQLANILTKASFQA